jgi:hypothetical protein
MRGHGKDAGCGLHVRPSRLQRPHRIISGPNNQASRPSCLIFLLRANPVPRTNVWPPARSDGHARMVGGSVWESNPPSGSRRARSPALKAGKVTGPLSPPHRCKFSITQGLLHGRPERFYVANWAGASSGATYSESLGLTTRAHGVVVSTDINATFQVQGSHLSVKNQEGSNSSAIRFD